MIALPPLDADAPLGFLFKFTPAGSSPRRWTTLPRAVEIGGETYVPGPVVAGGGFARMSSTLTRAAFELRISDPGWALRTALEANRGSQGAALVVSIVAAAAAVPLRSAVCVAATDSHDANGPVLSLRFCNPLSRLGDTRARLVDPSAQREFDPDDTAFDHCDDKFTFVFGYRS